MKRWLTLGALAMAMASSHAEPAAAAIPYKQDAAVTAAALPGGALGVLLVSALAIVVVLVLRKRLNLQPRRDGARHLRVLETQRLGPRTLLAVVEFAGGQYLIAQSEHGVSCLAAAPGTVAPLPAAPVAGGQP
ncbi:hypothetical protein GJ699_29830 [Duganella sp. FT80W]|uniref:Flagellar biosynthetic protein FliO n=1 Tax=Duganella guangzhouensis TaxID=2666084 RepID=A0A6I2L7L8_9BURK|nr:flagellar biosynthetic protein FliO [Duganella guangzhouensis]MRW94181.1 hypothetical protein [Duganella guangzhouensis]